jgi:hypothetical protein
MTTPAAEPTDDRTDTPTAGHPGTPSKQHGDPLLDNAQGRNAGEEGTRHGHDATPGRLEGA